MLNFYIFNIVMSNDYNDIFDKYSNGKPIRIEELPPHSYCFFKTGDFKCDTRINQLPLIYKNLQDIVESGDFGRQKRKMEKGIILFCELLTCCHSDLENEIYKNFRINYISAITDLIKNNQIFKEDFNIKITALFKNSPNLFIKEKLNSTRAIKSAIYEHGFGTTYLNTVYQIIQDESFSCFDF